MAMGDSGRSFARNGRLGIARSGDSLAPPRQLGQPPPLPKPQHPNGSISIAPDGDRHLAEALLAERLGIALVGWNSLTETEVIEDGGDPVLLGLTVRIDGRTHNVLCAEGGDGHALEATVSELKRQGVAVALAPRAIFDAAIEKHRRAERMEEAVYGLLRRSPVSSAGSRIWIRQVIAGAVAAGLIGGGLSTEPQVTVRALVALVALPFLCITLLRIVALREVIRLNRRDRRAPALLGVDPADLPTYSVLVPLFEEATVLGGLVQSLQALDYPAARLEVFLILEESDLETQAAVLGLALPAHFRTIVVPDHAPRTKPKALNYALPFARGEFVVVYDAEDRPEPDQLRRALDLFRQGPAQLGCVQAQLNIYNPRASWFTRQFTIEYSALFDAILPALIRVGLPVPLGGTSNHLRRKALVDAGAWDPFNVTEDADLGFRLARQGWRTAVLASTTWEEAPPVFRQWFRQRTRWLKGWMQTYLVHTRQPLRLIRELGLRGAFGVHVLMGALVLSALVHPLFYALLGYHALSGEFLAWADTGLGATLWTIAWVNLSAGYLVSIFVGALSVSRRGRPGLAVSALLMPVCWLLVSAAAYRALYQLATDPYRWEKTAHGTPLPSRRRSRTRPALD